MKCLGKRRALAAVLCSCAFLLGSCGDDEGHGPGPDGTKCINYLGLPALGGGYRHTGGMLVSVAVAGSYAYVADGESGFR